MIKLCSSNYFRICFKLISDGSDEMNMKKDVNLVKLLNFVNLI